MSLGSRTILQMAHGFFLFLCIEVRFQATKTFIGDETKYFIDPKQVAFECRHPLDNWQLDLLWKTPWCTINKTYRWLSHSKTHSYSLVENCFNLRQVYFSIVLIECFLIFWNCQSLLMLYFKITLYLARPGYNKLCWFHNRYIIRFVVEW